MWTRFLHFVYFSPRIALAAGRRGHVGGSAWTRTRGTVDQKCGDKLWPHVVDSDVHDVAFTSHLRQAAGPRCGALFCLGSRHNGRRGQTAFGGRNGSPSRRGDRAASTRGQQSRCLVVCGSRRNRGSLAARGTTPGACTPRVEPPAQSTRRALRCYAYLTRPNALCWRRRGCPLAYDWSVGPGWRYCSATASARIWTSSAGFGTTLNR